MCGVYAVHTHPHSRWWASSKRCPLLMIRRDSLLKEEGLRRMGSLSASLFCEGGGTSHFCQGRLPSGWCGCGPPVTSAWLLTPSRRQDIASPHCRVSLTQSHCVTVCGLQLRFSCCPIKTFDYFLLGYYLSLHLFVSFVSVLKLNSNECYVGKFMCFKYKQMQNLVVLPINLDILGQVALFSSVSFV